MSYFLNLKGISYKNNRQECLDIVDRFLDVNTFDDYYFRWYKTSSNIQKDDLMRMYNPYGYMKKIINEMVLLSPMMQDFNTNNKTKIKLLRKQFDIIKWNNLLPEIFETLETKGDFFAYWYYEEGNPFAKIKVLDPRNMKDITMDNNNEPTGYVYEEVFLDQIIDEPTGKVVDVKQYTVQTIFKKGYIRVNDSYNIPEGFKIYPNKKQDLDKIRIIHVPSFKKQREKFSTPPSIDYLDKILLLDAITSDLRLINRLIGFPIMLIGDGEFDWDNSALTPAGVVKYKSSDDALLMGKQAVVTQQEIKNNLQTIQDERDLIDSALYKEMGLIREKMEQKLSGDSSRMFAQLRLLLENKYEKYCTSIQKAFAPYCESVLKENNQWNKDKDEMVSLELPDNFVNTSIFDDLAIMNTKMAMGQTTMTEEWDKKGMNEEAKAYRKKNIQEEVLLGNEDPNVSGSVKQTALNGKSSEINQLDNQMKQATNIPV